MLHLCSELYTSHIKITEPEHNSFVGFDQIVVNHCQGCRLDGAAGCARFEG